MHGPAWGSRMEADGGFFETQTSATTKASKGDCGGRCLDLNMTCVASSHISLVRAIHTVVSESEWVKTRDSTVFPRRGKQMFVKALTTKGCLLPCPAERLASPIFHRWRLKSHAFPTPGLAVL